MNVGNLQAGGTLRPGRIYVERAADGLLVNHLLASELCYVLGPRQIGKSSLLLRTIRTLRGQGVQCAAVDLSGIGTAQISQANWYGSLIRDISKELAIPESAIDTATLGSDPVSAFRRFLQDVVLGRSSGKIVIFIDEIEAVRSLRFSAGDFFAAIRFLYNGRSQDPALSRLTFCLLGVATPDDLVSDPLATPFNIGVSIPLADFSPKEARGLLPGLQSLPAPVQALEAILSWTDGHPYMTQRLCIALLKAKGHKRGDVAQVVERLVSEVFLVRPASADPNLSYGERYFRQRKAGEQQSKLLELYRRVLKQEEIEANCNEPVQLHLIISGMIALRAEGSRSLLRVRNRVFASVFDLEWVTKELSDRHLSVSLNLWVSQNRDPHYLLRGDPLRRAEAWAHKRTDLTEEENLFLRHSLEEARRRWRLALIWGGSIVGVIVLLTGSLINEKLNSAEIGQQVGACLLGAETDCHMAFVQSSKGCEANKDISCNQLAGMYEKGRGVPKDLEQARSLYQKTCDRENGIGCNSLGFLYERGLGTPVDHTKAATLYHKACEMNYGLGCSNLGFLHERGLGLKQSYKAAYEFYERACALGAIRGCSNLGYLIEQGHVGTRDLTRARSLYKKACDGNMGIGCVNLGFLEEQNDRLAEAATHYEKACRLREPKGCTHLGYLYSSGKGRAEDRKLAAENYRIACEHPEEPDSRACNNLGVLYEKGGAVEKDPIKALALYRHSCQQGYKLACDNMRDLSKQLGLQAPSP